jgi:hypothetical protein
LHNPRLPVQCRGPWPRERSLVENLKAKPFALIGVNLNGYGPKMLKQVMWKENLTWRTFADPGTAVGERWGAGPATYYVIDHRGVIR